MPDLRRAGFRGGAYVGVGPDQNFSYIAAVRPSIAFILDVRRDNLLLHLLFKALFQLARTPRRIPGAPPRTSRPSGSSTNGATASIEKIVAYMDDRQPIRERVRRAPACIGSHRRRLRRAALATRIWRRSTASTIASSRRGSSCAFNPPGGRRRAHYPTTGSLLVGQGSRGTVAANYLAAKTLFKYIKALQSRDLIIPVIGNLSGPSALASIGSDVAQRRDDRSPCSMPRTSSSTCSARARFRDFTVNLRRVPHTIAA